MTAGQNNTARAVNSGGDGGLIAGDDPRNQGYGNTTARASQAATARAAILALLDGKGPNGTDPAQLGPWAQFWRPLADATPAERGRIFDALCRQDPGFAKLMAGDPPAEPAPRRKYIPVPVGQVKDLPPVSWLIKGEIPKHGLTLLYGPTSGGKSFVALDYAFQIAATRPVVYLCGEGYAGYAARVLAWTIHNADKDPGQLYFVGEAVNLLDPAAVNDFLTEIKDLAPAVVVIDTLARAMLGGDENANRDMGLAVDAADRIKRAIGDGEAGGAVILVHHATKAGNTERGGGALKAGCDQVIRLDNDDGLLTLTCEKSKDASAFEPRNLRLLPIATGRRNDDGEEETSCVVVPAEKIITAGTVTPSGRKILEKLALEVFAESGARTAALMDATGLVKATFYKAASALLRDGYITQDAKGEPFRITEEGRGKLKST
jgi:hypothetical protein